VSCSKASASVPVHTSIRIYQSPCVWGACLVQLSCPAKPVQQQQCTRAIMQQQACACGEPGMHAIATTATVQQQVCACGGPGRCACPYLQVFPDRVFNAGVVCIVRWRHCHHRRAGGNLRIIQQTTDLLRGLVICGATHTYAHSTLFNACTHAHNTRLGSSTQCAIQRGPIWQERCPPLTPSTLLPLPGTPAASPGGDPAQSGRNAARP